jgi:tripartite-type tricarboxylate transporter receptor subunit TctC
MSIERRGLLIAASLALPVRQARAQTFPDHATRVTVPYAAGGTDQYIRPLQQSFAHRRLTAGSFTTSPPMTAHRNQPGRP